MKKSSAIVLAILMVASFVFSSCGPRMHAKKAFRKGHHGTWYGEKLQVQTKRMNKHFWF